MARSPLTTTLLAAPCLWLLVAGGLPARAGQKVPTFPTSAELRQVQLAALACSRENTAADCSRARSLADPLMDNPLLPAFCKDAVWEIVQKAQPAASNSFERREQLNDASDRMVRTCRQVVKAPPKDGANPGSNPFGGGSGGGPGSGLSPSRP